MALPQRTRCYWRMVTQGITSWAVSMLKNSQTMFSLSQCGISGQFHYFIKEYFVYKQRTRPDVCVYKDGRLSHTVQLLTLNCWCVHFSSLISICINTILFGKNLRWEWNFYLQLFIWKLACCNGYVLNEILERVSRWLSQLVQ